MFYAQVLLGSSRVSGAFALILKGRTLLYTLSLPYFLTVIISNLL